MLQTGLQAPPFGRWALHVADVNLATSTLSHGVAWQDPDGRPTFYEAYGWLPNTHMLLFMSGTRATSKGLAGAQLFTLRDNLPATAAPVRMSPRVPTTLAGASDAFHEFAHFAPRHPRTLYTSVAANTVGGDDLFAYSLRTRSPSRTLGQPRRISYFGGEKLARVPGWPAPSYRVVTTMAWVRGAWAATTCPDALCTKVDAWRIRP